MTDTLFARESGAGAKTLVLLHGFGASHAVWNGIAPRLADDGQVLAYDLPGHAASLGFAGAGPAKVAAKAVLADLATRGIETAHVVGHSMGGAVATLMALIEPARIASATLLAPGGFGEEINGRLLRRYAAAREVAELRLCLENMFGWSNPVPEATVAALAAQRALPGQTDMLVRIAAAMTRDDKQGVIPRAQLATLEMPVKVLWGTQDRVLPTRQSHRLPPCFAAHIFEDTGHMLAEERPDAVVRLIRENIR